MSQRPLVLVAISLVTLAGGCQKSSRGERAEAKIAQLRVESTGKEVVHELEHDDAKAINRALENHAVVSQNLKVEEDEAIAAAARERATYKQLLEKELGLVDHRLFELETETTRATEKAKDVKTHDLDNARAFRVLLQNDLDEIERTGEGVWPPLKEKIDHDLEEERPTSVPRALDKSYGI